MDKIAFLQADPDSGCQYEMSLLRSSLPARGFALKSYSRTEMLSGELDLPRAALVAGEMTAVVAAMRQMEIPVPVPNDYPRSLRDLLCRNVWTGTFGELARRFATLGAVPIFAKPAGDRKLFQGRVFRSSDDLFRAGPLPPETPLFFSDVIPIISEFRFFVIESRVVACENYDGDPRDTVDRVLVTEAIARLDAAGESLAAYAIDFGLIRDGRTALIEMNDGFSVGSYREITPDNYADFTIRRWSELLELRDAQGA